MTPKNNAEKGGQVPATLMTKPQAKISQKSSKKKSQKGNAPENVESESRKLKKCSTSVARESDQNPILDDEIDGLFDKLKAAKKQKMSQGKGKGEGEGEAEMQNPIKKKKPPKIQGSKDDLFGTNENKGRKKTEEGYAIYTEEELGLNKKGGDTDLCPFDCDCCF